MNRQLASAQERTQSAPITVGELFARAVAARDSSRIRSVLSDEVDFEALTPRRHWVASTSRQAADEIILKHWIGPDDEVNEIRSIGVGQVADRERVSYRLGIRRDARDYVLEQQAYYTSDGGRISWMRILCSGYRPAESSVGQATSPGLVFSADESCVLEQHGPQFPGDAAEREG